MRVTLLLLLHRSSFESRHWKLMLCAFCTHGSPNKRALASSCSRQWAAFPLSRAQGGKVSAGAVLPRPSTAPAHLMVANGTRRLRHPSPVEEGVLMSRVPGYLLLSVGGGQQAEVVHRRVYRQDGYYGKKGRSVRGTLTTQSAHEAGPSVPEEGQRSWSACRGKQV